MHLTWSISPRERRISQASPHSPSPMPLPTADAGHPRITERSSTHPALMPAPYSYTYGQPALPSRNIGRDYLKSLSSSFANVQLGDSTAQRVDKPLPAIPSDEQGNSPDATRRTYPAQQGLPAHPCENYDTSSRRPFPTYNSPHSIPLAGPSKWASSSRPSTTQVYGYDTYRHNPPPVPPRPYSEVTPMRVWSEDLYESTPSQRAPPNSRPLPQPDPYPQQPTIVSPPRTFRASSSLKPPTPPHTQRPHSDPIIPFLSPSPRKPPRKPKHSPSSTIIDFTHDSSSESSDATPNITKRSPARRRRVQSEQPHISSIPIKRISAQVYPDSPSSRAIKCSGYTRKGQPCQRLVKGEAPYLSLMERERDGNLGEVGEERVGGRYCKDHAGMICGVEGFYWRGNGGGEKEGIWVNFADYIPSELGLQTQALLRMTMESPLTDKESSGFLYAYELRDLQTDHASYFKVGRTDNVPRRIGEWTTRCSSHSPTLRDIFPLSQQHDLPPDDARPTSTSYLPGALRHSLQPLTSPASKRWERLVHLELADRASQTAKKEYDSLKERCTECKAVHKEIFPVARAERVYEDVIRECICRWERFITRICND